MLIVARGRRDVYEALHSTFGADTTEVLVDRRVAERRRRAEDAVGAERRQRDRRGRHDIETELRSRGWALVRGGPGGVTADVAQAPAGPRRHQCSECGSASVQRDVRRDWRERWLMVHRRPYYCLVCGARFYDRPIGDSRRAPLGPWWRAAIGGTAGVATTGAALVAGGADASPWTLGLDLLVLGLVGLIVAVSAVRLTRRG